MSFLDKLNAMGVTQQEAKDFIYNNLNHPQNIFSASQKGNLTTKDLGEILSLPETEIVDYFTHFGIDVNSLNNQRTDIFMISDLSSGKVWGFNAFNGINKELFSFNTTITDIATHHSGDVYGISFTDLYKYNFETQTVTHISKIGKEYNALEISGNKLYLASTDNSAVEIRSLDGNLISKHNLIGGSSAGDISIIGQSLFRTTISGIYETDLITGSTHMEVGSIGAKYHGLAKSKYDVLAGFAYDGEVKGYYPQTGFVYDGLSDVKIVGMNSVSGATQMLQMHLDKWA